MSDTYLTIAAPSEGLYKEKGSKFLAFAYPARTEDEVKDHLTQLRKTYFDARHHCYAYILGADKTKYRANDDGEPNHSAGDPILGQIRSRNLTDVLVVVVRYFGGIKLGVSGLIQAYRTSASEALETAQIIEKIVMMPFSIQFTYEQMNQVMKLLKDYDAEILSQDFQLVCNLTAAVRKNHYTELLGKFTFQQIEVLQEL
ncbi:YigZ family protein [Cytophagaceae bacterium YF14B1]|uniref:YigZ family protein n=1 Tax=Xanthocytophaga flava TaxID=3048013 RepID=A0AAE3QPV6_9BACT|nr:YigZ family protein [Xanthocytophaga flavus]MDJ1483277.1 YigZ family protein [Xanthocytophaga flavus]